jgi:hypothetical protein
MTRPEGDLSPYPLMAKFAMVRGIFVGAREHFDALMKAVAVNKLAPVIDKTFDFDAAPEAVQIPQIRAALRQGRHQDVTRRRARRFDIDNASCRHTHSPRASVRTRVRRRGNPVRVATRNRGCPRNC